MILLFLYTAYFLSLGLCFPFIGNSYSQHDGCTDIVHQELSVIQGMRPDTKHNMAFGYINSIQSPLIQVGPDISIRHQSPANLFPTEASVILNEIIYNQDKSLIIRGRVSQLNAERLSRVPVEGSIVSLKFDIFKYDKSRRIWYKSLSTTQHGISGEVIKAKVIYQLNGRSSHQEIVMEIVPLVTAENLEYLYLATSSDNIRKVSWNGPNLTECHKQHKLQKKNKFNEMIDSSILI
ncbi:hypothetical protein BDB01DRAFT_770242 [Pilobolus umbonatus]|nr:hypothetical protein BDB01DRAFT_770242 [Pilobolus umbonatus]